MRAVRPEWLVAVIPDGLAFVGRSAEVRVDLALPFEAREAAAGALAAGVDGDELARLLDAEPATAEALLGRLAELGALGEPRAESHDAEPTPLAGATPLAEAILAAARGDDVPDACVTAEEALLMPRAIPGSIRREVLRRFVAGIEPHIRLEAYCVVARWGRPTAFGDRPDAASLKAALGRAEKLDARSIHVVDLASDDVRSIPVTEVDRGAGARPNRLGPVLHARTTESGIDGLVACEARHAPANLAFPGTDQSGWARGFARRAEDAELIARAEAVERYAAGDVSRLPLVRAREAELTSAVPVDAMIRLGERQYERLGSYRRRDPEARQLWTPAVARDRSRRWVLAETVLYPFEDPEQEHDLPPVTSSGTATHMDHDAAAAAAFRELVERDAFMWTWIQRISRERLRRASLPDDLKRLAAGIEASGYEVEVVNLTLDLHPVMLCVIFSDGEQRMGASCHPEPAQAARKAMEEAASMLATASLDHPAPELRSIRTPHDHLLLHQGPAARQKHGFLFSSSAEVDLGDLLAASAPVEQAVEAVGEPLTIDLSSPLVHPFRVVRAVVPGLVPVTFGFDREPLGMERLGQPKRCLDGRTLGRRLDLDLAEPLHPHPFP